MLALNWLINAISVKFSKALAKSHKVASPMSRPHREFSDDHTPLAYLITFRSYGTWLHGDPRGSVDRFHNVYGTPRLPPNSQREKYERLLLARPPVKLNAKQSTAVERGITETC